MKPFAKKPDDLHFEEAVFGPVGFDPESYIELPLHRQVFLAVGALALLVGVVIAGRIVFLAVSEGKDFQVRAAGNAGRESSIAAPRGIIYDRFGQPLIQNEPVFSVFLSRVELDAKSSEERERLLNDIRMALGQANAAAIDFDALSAEMERGATGLITLVRGIDTAAAIALKGLNEPSVQVANDFRRHYLYGPSFSHILGYTGMSDTVSRVIEGKSGLEEYYNKFLSGEDGRIIEGRNARGDILYSRLDREAKPGAELHLTIDAEFQRYFFNRMQDGLRTLGRDAGAGLAINPQTGEVLAMVSFPSFDNNIFVRPQNNAERSTLLTAKSQPLFNRVISGVYSPGSTFKPLVALAALREKIIDPVFSVFSSGFMEIPNPFDPAHPSRFLDWRAQGWVNLYSALAQSCNVYFYTIGGGFEKTKGLGVARIQDYWRRLGFDGKTDVDLPSEGRGFFYGPDERAQRTGGLWRIGDTYNISIGQGDLGVTPIRLLNFIGALGIGGKIQQPFLAQEVRDSQGKTLERFAPRASLDFSEMLPEIFEVQKGLKSAVSSPQGTAHSLADLPFSAAGKTGSAQISSNTKVNAFFVGYAPAENPEISVLVLVEDAKEGSLNAVPIAKDVLRWYYENRMKK